MDSQEDQQHATLGKIRIALLSSLDFAAGFARQHPEHAAAVAWYSHAIRTALQQVMEDFERGAPPTWHDVMLGSIAARGMAELLAERVPEKQEVLSRFEHAVLEAQNTFTRDVKKR